MKIHITRNSFSRKLAGLAALSVMFASTLALAESVEVIVDNRSENTNQIGTWWTSSGPNPYLGNSIYNKNRDGLFSWYPALPQPGDYDVYAWWTYHENRSPRVPFRVNQNDLIVRIDVDMHNQALAGQWNLLGRFTFSEGTIPEISVSGENGQASADAVRFVLRGSPEPPGPSGLSGWSKQSITCVNRSPGTRAGEGYFCDRRCLPAGTRILGGGGDYAQVHPGSGPGPIEWEMVSSAPIADDMWRTVWRANTVTTVNFAATTYALCATEAAPP